MLLCDKAKDFLQKAFTIIFVATIVIWFMTNFDFRFDMTTDSGNSILAVIAGYVAPVFEPLGFGNWKFATAIITGFLAKESVVSSLKVVFGGKEFVSAALTSVSACSMMVFCLLYTPCVAAVASVKRELGGRWAVFMVVFQCAVAWVCAFLVSLVGGAIFG